MHPTSNVYNLLVHVGIIHVISYRQDEARVREHRITQFLYPEHIAQILRVVFPLQCIQMVF